jgi:Flp pilus assembly protein TadG
MAGAPSVGRHTFRGIAGRVGRLIADRRGAAVAETAIVMPVFVLLIFGVIESGLLMFAQLSLDNAVGAAARCAAVNTNRCDTQAHIQSYALAQAVGVPRLTVANFTAPAPPICNNGSTQVSATYNFTSLVGTYVPFISALTLKAAAQYPC